MSFLSLLLFGAVTQGTDGASVAGTTNVTGVTCGGEGVLTVIRFVTQLLDIVLFIVPIGLIVMVMVDFLKNVIAGKEDDMKKNRSIAIKRILFAVALFLVEPIVYFCIGLLGDLGVDYAKCIEIARSDEDLSQYRVEFEEDNYEGIDTGLSSGSPYVPVSPNDDSDDSGSSGSSDSTDSSSTVDENTTIIYVGDSRFQGMKNVVDYDADQEKWITAVGKGYDWLRNSALDQIRSYVNESSDAIIVINLGVNDFGNISKYITLYRKIAVTYKDSKIVIVSVNPIEDSRNTSYTVKDSQVVSFNDKIKSGLVGDNQKENMEYCDVYSQIKDDFSTTDGVHYTNSTSQKIYDEIQKCL